MSKPKKIEVIRADDVQFIDSHASTHSMRGDSAFSVSTGMFFKSQLEYTFTQALTATIPKPNALSLFSINTEVNEGATTYKQRMYEPTGEAVIISNFASDLPRVNVTQSEASANLKYIGDSYSYSMEDIMAARFAGEPLDTTLGVAAREISENKHNKMAWWGDRSHNIRGVLTHDFIPRYLNAVPFDATAASADAIITELIAILNASSKLTKTAAKADTLILDPDAYSYIMHAPRSATSDTSIGEYLLTKFKDRGLQVFEAWELGKEFNNGKALGVAYRRALSISQSYVASLLFRQEPVRRVNLEFVVDCLGKSGGFYAPRPLEIIVFELK